MDELSLAQGKINQLTRRIEELEELIRVAREHALQQQTQYDLLEQQYQDLIDERLYDDMTDDDEEEEEEEPNSPFSKIIQD